MPESAPPRVDPITLEIIRGSLASAIRDMELLMERCAMSPFIKEKKDYFVGIFDTRGRIVACHISGSGPGMLQPILKLYPLETMRPGDVYWFNDPYVSDGAVQHHQDMVFTVPIFHDGQPVALSITFGHYQDIGGLRAGSISPHATEIYHEGVLVPPVRIVREGQLNQEAYRIFLRNSRLPDMVEGDTRAMMASCHLAESRLVEVVTLDGSGSDDQARGPINFVTNPGLLRIAFGRYLQMLEPDLDVNQGLLQNLDHWIAREGRLLNPRFPAPLGMRANTRFRV